MYRRLPHILYYVFCLILVTLQNNYQRFLSSTPSTFGLITYWVTDQQNYLAMKQHINHYASMVCPEMTQISIALTDKQANIKKNQNWQRPVYYVETPLDLVDYHFTIPPESKAMVYFTIDSNILIHCEELRSSFALWKAKAFGDLGPIMSYEPSVFEFYTVKEKFIQKFIPNFRYFSNGRTSAAWVSRFYLELYNTDSCMQINKIRQVVRKMNMCEDIALNFIVNLFFPEILPAYLPNSNITYRSTEVDPNQTLTNENRGKCQQLFTLEVGYNTLRIINRQTIEKADYQDQVTSLSVYIRRQQIINKYLRDSKIFGKYNVEDWQKEARMLLEQHFGDMENFEQKVNKAKLQFEQKQNRELLLQKLASESPKGAKLLKILSAQRLQQQQNQKAQEQQNEEILKQIQYAKKVLFFVFNLLILTILIKIFVEKKSKPQKTEKKYDVITTQQA